MNFSEVAANCKNVVAIPHALHDNWLHEAFPAVQDQNRRLLNEPILLDFRNSSWLSPLPLLALATEIASTSPSNRLVLLDLGDGSSTDKDAATRARARKYLVRHGFLDGFLARPDLNVCVQFDKAGEAGFSGQWHTDRLAIQSIKESIEKLGGNLMYGERAVVPATIWQLPKVGDENLTQKVRKKVKELLGLADSSLFKYQSDSARQNRDVSLQRITQILLELVENAAEHAYEHLSNHSGHVGIYVRLRENAGETNGNARAQELVKSPLLSKILAGDAQHPIEVFVVDVGRGLFGDIDVWKDDALKGVSRMQPLRTTSRLLFSKPLSRHDRSLASVATLRGTSTGLMHLDAILRHKNDVSRIVTGREWLAGPHPRPTGFHEGTSSSGGYKLSDGKVTGTIFHLGISPSIVPALNRQWFESTGESSRRTLGAVIRKFSQLAPGRKLESGVIDIRNSDGIEGVQLRVRTRSVKDAGTVVRFNRVADKNLINAIVRTWVEGVGINKNQDAALYLCDLSRYQSVDTLWVLENLFGKRDRIPLPNVPKKASIFLFTEDLCCTQLILEFVQQRGQHYLVKIMRATASIDKLENRIVYVLRALRECDSELFWRRIRTLECEPVEIAPIVRNVQWSEHSSVLPIFLNFAALVKDAEIARTMRRSLRRMLSLFPYANDQALDSLVNSTLHDAKKWMVRPTSTLSESVLIGSISVSGSTLQRYRSLPGTTITGVVDCIRSPYYKSKDPTSEPAHLSALLWDPELPTTSTESPRYRRVGQTAFVERIEAPLIRPQYDELLYEELEVGRLVKVGHWTHGGRHSVLEINAELAIEQSGASESGVIPWLVAELCELLGKRPVVLAYPIDSLAHRLAHHVRARIESKSDTPLAKLNLLPLTYMPRFAGGLTRLSPLAMDSAVALAKSSATKELFAVFLDFGFITNRTLRHTVRQLAEAGFKDIRAAGLLNRSSAPALPHEQRPWHNRVASPVPRTFWRWAVPTLGSGNSCIFCASMSNLSRLRRVLEDTHLDLVAPIERISKDWAVRQISDFWYGFGLEPLPLSPETIAALSAPALSISSVPPRQSSTVAARIIEYLRATGDCSRPAKIINFLLAEGEGDLAAEITSVILLLAGGSLTPTDLSEFVVNLVDAAILSEFKSPRTGPARGRRNRLLGLVAIVFSSLESACKLAVLKHLTAKLSHVDILDASYLRIAIIALTSDSDASASVQRAFTQICTEKGAERRLRLNYQSLRPSRGTSRESWSNLSQAFGRSESHSQQSVYGNIFLDVSRRGDPSRLAPQIQRLTSLLAQCDPVFVLDALGFDITLTIPASLKVLNAYAGETKGAAAFLAEMAEIFGDLQQRIHATLVRFGDRAKSKLVYDAFFEVLRDQCAYNALELGTHVLVSRESQLVCWEPSVGGYLPIDLHVAQLFGEIFSNIAGKGVEVFEPRESGAPDRVSTKALAWIRFDCISEAPKLGMSVVITSGLRNDSTPQTYVPKVSGLTELGIGVTSHVRTINGCRYFEIKVRLPSFDSILEIP